MSGPADRARDLAPRLLGTCMSLAEALGPNEEHLINNAEFCSELDQHVLECTKCSWWVETDEINGDGECEDCADADE